MNTRPAHTDFNIGDNKFINSKLPVFNDGKELQKFLETNFTESLKQFIRSIIKMTIKEEMDQFRNEINEKIQFNGNYYRNMMSTMGKIDNIPIPRFRQPGLDFTPKSISVFDNEQDKFMQLVEQMHLNGISQRKISKIAKDCFGLTFSKNRVGKVYAEFARQESVNINSQPISDNFEYLYIDGVYVKSKGYGYEDNKAVLLCVHEYMDEVLEYISEFVQTFVITLLSNLVSGMKISRDTQGNWGWQMDLTKNKK